MRRKALPAAPLDLSILRKRITWDWKNGDSQSMQAAKFFRDVWLVDNKDNEEGIKRVLKYFTGSKNIPSERDLIYFKSVKSPSSSKEYKSEYVVHACFNRIDIFRSWNKENFRVELDSIASSSGDHRFIVS